MVMDGWDMTAHFVMDGITVATQFAPTQAANTSICVHTVAAVANKFHKAIFRPRHPRPVSQ